VRITSRYGSAELSLRILDSIRHGEAFATFTPPECLSTGVTGLPHRCDPDAPIQTHCGLNRRLPG
jgi:hypothetical protein